MTRLRPGTLLRVLAPVLVGAALGAALQATEPGTRLYLTASPGLVAAMAGLLATVIAAVVTVARRRAHTAAAAVTEAAVRQATDEATRDRFRFFMQLDHEL